VGQFEEKIQFFQQHSFVLVMDAVAVEAVSIPKFPANREKNRKKNREFVNFGPIRGSEAVIRPMI